jgi:hypothetical protein
MRGKSLALALAALIGTLAGAQAAPRAVVELFTSPFCSSCPPADELFVELARSPDLITLVMPVDSYDRPGRKDALAKPAFTDRQAGYADVRNENMLFTPQAMINGAVPAMGSDAQEIADAIGRTADLISVPVSARIVGKDIMLSVGGAKLANAGVATITVLPYVASRRVPMRGGETIHYANLVRDIIPVDTWIGKPLKARLSRQDFAEYDGIVVLVQAGTRERPGAILGAARVPMSAQAKSSPHSKS